jgi:hypothetical protein
MNILNKLNFYFNINKNVLLIGPHGVGKTSLVKNVFESNGLKVGDSALIFSASTMDPWTDLIGIPYPIKNSSDTEVKYLKPSHINEEKVQAIFFDEFNRSHKKIRNAVMELIQFKSINGRPFPNLKVVWAAINPEDDETNTYDVEPLDPAQKDRFHIQITVENSLNREFFLNKFGIVWTESAFDWWNTLPDKIKQLVSPRRLEYALEVYSQDGDLSDVLPEACLPKKLAQALSQGSPKQKFLKIIESNNDKQLKEFLKDFSNISSVSSIIETDDNIAKKCLHNMPKEALVGMISRSFKFRKIIESQVSKLNENTGTEDITEDQKTAIKIISEMAKVDSDKSLSIWAKKIRESIIPGSKLLDEDSITAKDAVLASKERYKITDKYENKKYTGKYKEYDKNLVNHWKKLIKNGNTYDRASVISDAAKLNKTEEDHWAPYLDIAEEYVKRSQEKTINLEQNKKNISDIVDWALKQMAKDPSIIHKDYDKEDLQGNIMYELIHKYPSVFIKFIAPNIEKNKSFSILELTPKALKYAEL